MLTISCKLAKTCLECHLGWTKFKKFLGGHAPDPLACAAFNTELLSEIVEISYFVHKTCQELAIKVCPTTFSFAPMPLQTCNIQ